MTSEVTSPTHRKRSDRLGDIPPVVVKVRYGNRKVCLIVERTKGPMRPIVKRIDQVHTIALCFESGRGYDSTIFGFHFEEGPLLELGIDNLKEFPVNCDRNEK